MSEAAIQLFHVYLATAVLLALAYPLARAAVRVGRPGARLSLRLAQTIYVAALILPALALLIPPGAPEPINSAPQRFAAVQHAPRLETLARATVAVASAAADTAKPARKEAAELALLVALLGVALYLARLERLRRRLRRLPLIRAVGRVQILAGDGDPVPYSARLPGLAAVVLPLHLFRDARDLRIAVAHELQHHREGDTLWVHVAALVRAAFCWNPLAHAWSGWLDRLQEVACDAALIGRRRVSPQAYGHCLLRVAQTAASWSRRFVPVGTAGMASKAAGSFLKRRIEMIMTTNGKEGNRKQALIFGAIAVLVLMVGAVASRAAAEIEDRHMTIQVAASLAAAMSDAGLPIDANEQVVTRLNQFLGSAEQRKKLRAELEAMGPYREMIKTKLDRAGLPSALIALPLFESGYENKRVSSHGAAGLWQFIESTGRHYGLRVSSDGKDDRLDAGKETDAAIHYLRDLNLIFGDWRLALSAYNMGESHLIDLIRSQHTRDPWGLKRSGSESDYLAGAIAMMIIQRNPKLTE